jgi:alkaline phosphatase
LGFAAIGIVILAIVATNFATGSRPAAGMPAARGNSENPAAPEDMSSPADRPPRALYVFFLIGDGMGIAQIQAAQAYLARAHQSTGIPAQPYPPSDPKVYPLAMTRLPVCGLQTTYAADRFITDSAAAGTALACGIKARDGVISKKLDGSDAVTIAELAKDQGMKVGIITSVSVDHATPAVFYAHEASRNNYYNIGVQLANSDFDFFGGGGFLQPAGAGGAEPHVLDIAQAKGFTVARGATELAAISPGTRTIAIDPYLDDSQALYYEIDRVHDPETLTLAEYTAEAIRLLDNPHGFFMMIEGGKIDWACHANDARTAIDETLAFDKAVAEALAFYEQHPDDTLIVVTGDHETGGMTLGFAGTKYSTAFDKIAAQKMSYVAFGDKVLTPYKKSVDKSKAKLDDLLPAIEDAFGLKYDSLAALQKDELAVAFQRSIGNEVVRPVQEDQYLLYGGYEPLTVKITQIVNQNAGLGWTSYSHTGVPVTTFARGAGQELFAGYYDNTDIFRKLASVLGVSVNTTVASSK